MSALSGATPAAAMRWRKIGTDKLPDAVVRYLDSRPTCWCGTLNAYSIARTTNAPLNVLPQREYADASETPVNRRGRSRN